MSSPIEVQKIIGQETEAWNTKNVELLLAVFHPDMVWPWPPTSNNHDPMDWVLVQGRFNKLRWGVGWQQLFDTHELIRNIRTTQKIQVSAEADGAFAVVDIDTL